MGRGVNFRSHTAAIPFIDGIARRINAALNGGESVREIALFPRARCPIRTINFRSPHFIECRPFFVFIHYLALLSCERFYRRIVLVKFFFISFQSSLSLFFTCLSSFDGDAHFVIPPIDRPVLRHSE